MLHKTKVGIYQSNNFLLQTSDLAKPPSKQLTTYLRDIKNIYE